MLFTGGPCEDASALREALGQHHQARTRVPAGEGERSRLVLSALHIRVANVVRFGQRWQQKESGYQVGPILLGFLVFVLVGSSVIQILRTAQLGL